MKQNDYVGVAIRKALGATAFIAALAVPGLVQAQAALEEVVVTAQRRQQNLQDVGVSVTALGTEEIRDLGITNSMDIGRVAPGVVFTATSSGAAFSTLSIRGISQADYSPIQEAPNAIYVDEVYLSSNAAGSFGTYDLQRIEVLRGPQGTLFGRNSTGGLASFISAKPTEDFEGYTEAGYGRYGHYWLEGAVSGALSDRVRGRLSFKGEKADGWWENQTPGAGDAMETNSMGVRAQLEMDVTDNLLARLSLTYGRQPRHQVGTYKQKNFYFDANGMPRPQPASLDAWGTGAGNNLLGYRDPYADNRTGAFEDTGSTNSRLTSPTLLLQWTLGSTTIASITNLTRFRMMYNEETDGSPIDFAASHQNQKLDQFSQEFRANGTFGNHTWTAGLYYLDIDNDVFFDYYFPVLAGSDFAFDVYQQMRQKTRSIAPYGQVEWEISPTFRLTTGLRYTHDRKTFDSPVYFRELGNGYSGGTGSTVFPAPGYLVYDFREATVGKLAKQSEGLLSGKIQLDYRPADGELLYVGLSRGVKGAGFNANTGGGLTNEETPFKSESVRTIEVGGKFELLDKRLRLNGSLFHYDYNNYQGYAFNGIQGVVGNYQGSFHGADLELDASLPGNVVATFGGSYTHTNLKDVPTAYMGVHDTRAVMAPKWVANGSLRKDIPVGNALVGLNWNFNYISDRYASVDNNLATYVEGSLVHNVRVTYAMESSGLEFAAFVNNVSDKQRQTFVYDLVPTGGFTINVYDQPRTWGVSVRKSF